LGLITQEFVNIRWLQSLPGHNSKKQHKDQQVLVFSRPWPPIETTNFHDRYYEHESPQKLPPKNSSPSISRPCTAVHGS
jgi:hypothetical protein